MWVETREGAARATQISKKNANSEYSEYKKHMPKILWTIILYYYHHETFNYGIQHHLKKMRLT